jgi:hypothetical protein
MTDDGIGDYHIGYSHPLMVDDDDDDDLYDDLYDEVDGSFSISNIFQI